MSVNNMTNKETIQNNYTRLNTIIILLVAIFFNMVGIATGYYMNRPSIPKYVFTPDHIGIKKPQYGYMIDSQKDIDFYQSLAKKGIPISNLNLLKTGSIVAPDNTGFRVFLNDEKFEYVKKIEPKTMHLFGYNITLNTLQKRFNRLFDKIETEYELKMIKNSVNDFYIHKGRLKIGEYIVNDVANDPNAKKIYKYKYHIVSKEKYRFIPLMDKYLKLQENANNKTTQ